MSIPAVHWALSQRTGSSSRKAVLKCIAEWMIGEKAVDCYPTVEQIAFETELNRKTVMDATRALEKAGFIKKRRACNKKLQWETHYTLVGYEPSEWIGSRRPECRTFENPNVPKPEGTKNGTFEGTKTGTSVSPKNGTYEDTKNGTRTRIDMEDKESTRISMRTSGTSSAIAAVASAQAQTLPTSFSQSSNSQNHSEAGIAGKDSLSNASERSVAAHRDHPDTSDEQTYQNDAGCSQNASTCISGVCPENEPPPMSDEDLENLFADAQLDIGAKAEEPTGKSKRKRSSNAQKPESVSEQVWNDFAALRTKRRAPITETALKGIQREAEKAGITLEAALSTCCERGWQGFKAEWYRRATAKSSSPAPSSGGRYLTAQERYEERMRKAGEMSDAEYMAQFLRPTPLEIEARQRKNHESA